MADQIEFRAALKFTKGELKHTVEQTLKQVTTLGKRVYDVVLTVGTTEESVGPSFGDINTEGIFWIMNMDATNFVEMGYSTGVYGQYLYPTDTGIPAVGYLKPNATIYLKANTAACEVRVIVYERAS
jgi:hypothetical protein